jgi:hypothetical protein
MRQHTVVDDRQIGLSVRDDAPNGLAQMRENLTHVRCAGHGRQQLVERRLSIDIRPSSTALAHGNPR